MKKIYTQQNLSSLFFYISILIFIIAFNFTDTPTPTGWYQQWLPSIGPSPITDITFVDSLVGYAVTNYQAANDTDYILKTTNSGDNWNIIRTDVQQYSGFNRVVFLNRDTGYTCGVSDFAASYTSIQKTTNSGLNWFNVPAPDPFFVVDDISILNVDTFWIAVSSSPSGGLFRTTNGGQNWTQQYYQFGGNPAHIYMYNARIGFMDAGSLRKTTDGGQSWTPIIGAGNFLDMYFIDSLTGWKANVDFKKTTNGGLNWVAQTIPSGGNIFDNSVIRITKFNNDTIWTAGAILIVGGTPPARGIMFRTTSSGNTWLFQLPDTAIHINRYSSITFLNNKIGWAYHLASGGIHTTSGGNDTFFTPINIISSLIPNEAMLNQNYPNPFNPGTKIKFKINKKSNISIKVYEITGKFVCELINKELNPGEYETEFNAFNLNTNISSGIYFYSMFTDNNIVDTKKMLLIK
jgi:photosystem II stability/assembly factor-like uncharacterized protein